MKKIITKEELERRKKFSIFLKNRKDKTYEEIYGKEKAKNIKKKISSSPNIGSKTKSYFDKIRQLPELPITEVNRKEKNRLNHMGHFVSNETKIKQRIYRLNAKKVFTSQPEKKLQSFLLQLNIPFIPHKYISDIEHRYQADIYIPAYNLIIEADGTYYHNYPYGNPIDITRNKELWQQGYHVLRLWENEIKVIELNEFKNLLNKFGI